MSDSQKKSNHQKSTRKARILIVDDNPANLLALQAVLGLPNYQLVEADSGSRAVELCDKYEFALIVLDVQMPGLDGYATARKIKESSKNGNVPIIFVTASYKEDPYVRRGFEVGAVDYFGKPFDPEILQAKVAIYTDLYLRTKRLEETEELLKSHSQIKTLLEAMPVGVIVSDAHGEIYESNEEAKRIWGGVPYGDKAWWSDSGVALTEDDWAIARTLKSGESVTDHFVEIECTEGIRKTILSCAYPIKGKTGKVLGAVGVVQDITCRKELSEDLRQKAFSLFKDTQILQNRIGKH